MRSFARACAELSSPNGIAKWSPWLLTETTPSGWPSRPDDVAVIAYASPRIDGIEVTRRIRAKLPKTEVLIFTMYDQEPIIQQLLQAGARGYILKSDANEELIAAIGALASHQPYFTSKVSEALLDSFFAVQCAHEAAPLTYRERQILRLIAEATPTRAPRARWVCARRRSRHTTTGLCKSGTCIQRRRWCATRSVTRSLSPNG
jgi:CheY-like chemotaxis protein